jgi:hypothetical protein
MLKARGEEITNGSTKGAVLMSDVEKEDKRITRREFVKGAAVGAAAAAGAGLLAGCGPTPAPQIVKETVEVPVEVTKIVEVPAPGGAAGPVTLEVLDPSGVSVVTQVHAPRLDTLEGKTICLLINGIWQSWRTAPLIGELLQKQYPTAKIIPDTDLPTYSESFTADQYAEVVAAVKAAGCDGAIVGNAG